jgi:hypothetical protein
MVNNMTHFMIRYIKPAFLIIFFFSFCNGNQVKAQGRINEMIAEKFNRYCQSLPREEVYLHTDRSDYVAGEEIWLNAFLINRLTSRPDTDNRILYVELINPQNRPVAQRRLLLEKGTSPGMITIPDTVSTGRYTLRAYTNWMKNFLPGNCFSSNINIYNTFTDRHFSQTDNMPANVPATATSDAGFVVSTQSSGKDTIEISIIADDNYRIRNGDLCYLFIHTHGVININRPVYLSARITKFAVSRKSLLPGINHITIFDSKAKPVAQNFVYTQAAENNAINLNYTGNLSKRNRISLEIEPGIMTGSAIESMSISVAPAENVRNYSGISDYMIFGSEFGIVPDEMFSNKADVVNGNIIDEFLATAKSQWIDWDMILSDKMPDLKYIAEKEEHIITGRLVNSVSGVPDTGRYIFLSVPGKEAGFQYSKTRGDGGFSFRIPAGKDLYDIIIQPELPEMNRTIRVESSFPEKYFPSASRQVTSEQNFPAHIARMSVNYQVRKIYGLTSVGENGSKAGVYKQERRFYGKPDIELILDNYIKLPVMQEVFFELLPGVIMKNKKSQYEVSIADPVDNNIYYKPPVLFIDGVVVRDPSVIGNLDPEIIERIEVIREKYVVGDYLFYGLVNVISRKGDFSCVPLPDYAVRLRYRVTDEINPFTFPVYDTNEKSEQRIPDFRNTLYWNPSIKADENGKFRTEFYSSDFASDYVINIQGITSNGEAFSFRKTFQIK